MHDDLVTPDGGADGQPDPLLEPPVRPSTPLLRLGAPVVGELEPSASVASRTPSEVAATPEPDEPVLDAAADAAMDKNLLRRAALLRLVGFGRSRALR